MTRFRIVSLTFDEREKPATVTAVATRDAYRLVTDILRTDTAAEGSCTNRVTLKLDLADVVRVRQDCGKFRLFESERTQSAADIYASLNRVHRYLMET